MTKTVKRSLYWNATVSIIRSAVVPRDYRFLDVYMLKASQHVHDHELWLAQDARIRRMEFLRKLRDYAEDGKIAVIESGRDCDGVEYDGQVHIVDANKQAVQEYINHCLDWADGPMYFTLERPSVANQIQYESRDLVMEAYENGHPHSIVSRYP